MGHQDLGTEDQSDLPAPQGQTAPGKQQQDKILHLQECWSTSALSLPRKGPSMMSLSSRPAQSPRPVIQASPDPLTHSSNWGHPPLSPLCSLFPHLTLKISPHNTSSTKPSQTACGRIERSPRSFHQALTHFCNSHCLCSCLCPQRPVEGGCETP